MKEVGGPTQRENSLSWKRLMGILAVIVLGALALGLYPTWRWSGSSGLIAGTLAVVVDVLLLSASGALVCWSARNFTTAKTAQLFLFTGMGRIVLLLGVGQSLIWAFSLPMLAYWAWAALVYMPMLMAEVLWASKGLGQYHVPEEGSQCLL